MIFKTYLSLLLLTIIIIGTKEVYVCGIGSQGQLGLRETENKTIPEKLDFEDLLLLQNHEFLVRILKPIN